ncbi:hypothetical protein [Gorillibacterium sp. sgz5001074]|uniref:hypothetical protein n=1 Tax=Gorillibacterium sp. sgz5001074 TaxID=3446695 RepID=UPI003F666A19
MLWKKTLAGGLAGLLLTVGAAGAVFAADAEGTTSGGTSKAGHWTERLAKLEQKAAAEGMTVDQWIQAKISGRAQKDEKLQAAAAKKGVTVDELKSQRADVKAKAEAQGLTVKEYLKQQKEAKLAEKKAQMEAKLQKKLAEIQQKWADRQAAKQTPKQP